MERQWARVWRKTEASNGELRPNVRHSGCGGAMRSGWVPKWPFHGPGLKRKLSISSCNGERGAGKKERANGRMGWPRKQVAQDHKDDRRRTNSLGLQLKAEKVIYFVLRFLTTFSTLYNSNDSRKLQLPSSFLSPWLYKFSHIPQPTAGPLAASVFCAPPAPLSAR